MKRVMAGLLTFLGLAQTAGCSAQTAHEEFTDEVANRIRSHDPNLDVEIVGRLELKVHGPSRDDQRVYLDNAYQLFLSSEAHDRDELVERYVRSYIESLSKAHVQREQIVPVIKEAAWLHEMRRMFAADGKQYDGVYDVINDDLVVFYVQDTPSNIRYITQGDFDELGIERDRLRRVAVGNLRQILPDIEVHRGPVTMVTAGGNYEASLLLFDDLWERERTRVRGDLVVAVPTRDLLLFADSSGPEAVARLQEMATKAAGQGAYVVTDRLFLLKPTGPERFTSRSD